MRRYLGWFAPGLACIAGCANMTGTPPATTPGIVAGGTATGGTLGGGTSGGGTGGTSTLKQLQVTPIFSSPAFNLTQSHIAWSVDGSRLVFSDVNQNLWVVDAVAGGQPTRLLGTNGAPLVTTSPGLLALPYSFQIVDPRIVPALNGTSGPAPTLPNGSTAAVAPNGLEVAYVTSSGTLEWQLFAGGQVHTVGAGSAPSWSANGSLLGFINSQNDYVLLDLANGTTTEFSLPASVGYPVLAPSGQAIAFPVTGSSGSGISIGVFTQAAASAPPTGGPAGP